MAEVKRAIIIIKFGVPACLLFLLLMIMFSNESSGGNDALLVVTNGFAIPFRDKNIFTVTSPFGYRDNPLESGKVVLHTGIDLATDEGTDIIATADGVVERVGFEENGLGNYVFIKHEVLGKTIYSGYGHMLDDSIIVEVGQEIKQGDKVGEVGSTGASTGNHLHFMLMKDKISYKEEDLIDPTFVITGLDEEEVGT